MVEDPADTFRRRGQRGSQWGISSTALGLSPLCCAFWVPIGFTDIQLPSTGNILTALCSLSCLVLFEGCNCYFFFIAGMFTSVQEERRREGEGLRWQSSTVYGCGCELEGCAWGSNASMCFSGGCSWMPPYWVGKSKARLEGKN